MKTPEEIANACVTQYCTPDEYDGKVKAAIAAYIQAERDATNQLTELQAIEELTTALVKAHKTIEAQAKRIAELEKQALLKV